MPLEVDLIPNEGTYFTVKVCKQLLKHERTAIPKQLHNHCGKESRNSKNPIRKSLTQQGSQHLTPENSTHPPNISMRVDQHRACPIVKIYLIRKQSHSRRI